MIPSSVTLRLVDYKNGVYTSQSLWADTTCCRGVVVGVRNGEAVKKSEMPSMSKTITFKLTVSSILKVLTLSLIGLALLTVGVTQICLWTINQHWCNEPVPLHRPYTPLPTTPQTPLIQRGIRYGNGFLQADYVASHTQVQWNLYGDDCRQNTPARVNTHTDVSECWVTDMSYGNSYIAVCMDRNALGSNRSGDPDYSALLGWQNPQAGGLYYDRKTSQHDNAKVYVHVGGQGSGQPNHVMIGDDYVMPYGIGKPGQVITVPESGNQLVWK
jgi:hypothetical protein